MNVIRIFRCHASHLYLLFLFGFAFSACSPNIFSQTQGYRKIHPACSRVELSSSTLDVVTLKKLIACLNSNGEIDPIQKLVERIDFEDRLHHTDDLEAWVDFQNRFILSNPRLIYELTQTYYALNQRKQLDQSFWLFGRLAENDEFISAGMNVLQSGYFKSNRENLLKSFEELSSKVTPEGIEQLLKVGLTLARSQSFVSLQNRFYGVKFDTLLPLVEAFLSYLNEMSDPRHMSMGKEVIQAIVQSRFLETMDEVLGVTSQELKQNVSRTSSVIKLALKNEGHLLGELSSLFHYLNRNPIACLHGSKEVPSGVMHVIRELSDYHSVKSAMTFTSDAAKFLKRTNKLSLVALQPFCDYPPELRRFYPAMEELADQSEIRPAVDLLSAFYRVQQIESDGQIIHPLAQLLVNFLGDQAGIKKLMPILVQLNTLDGRDNVWDDVLLTASLLRVEDRPQLKEMLDYWIRPQSSIQGQSLFDVFSSAFAGSDPKAFAELIYSLRSLRGVSNADSKEWLYPVLSNLRSVLYVNDAHPVIDVIRDVMSHARQNKKFLESFFRISKMPEFRDSIHLVSEMAKDHRLKDLLGTVVSLFEKFGKQGQTEIHQRTEPVFDVEAHRRHDLKASDLDPFLHDERLPLQSWELACRELDFGINLANYSEPGFSDQISHFVACLNDRQQYAHVEESVRFLTASRTEDGRNFLEFTIDLIKDLKMNRDQLGFVINQWFRSLEDRSFSDFLDAVLYWVSPEKLTQKVGQDLQSSLQSVVEPLLHLSTVLLKEDVRPALDRLQIYGAQILRREDFPVLLRYVDDLRHFEIKKQPRFRSDVYDFVKIRHWIREHECRSQQGEDSRALEIISDYQDAITGWDLVQGQKGKSPYFRQPRREWTFSEFSKNFKSILDILAQPDAHGKNQFGDQKGKVFDSLLRFTHYFSLQSGQKPNPYQHYTVDDLVRWLRDRSNDHRLITYYYPGESRPRVRLVSSLDRLELVLIGADFNAPVLGTNYGLKFLADIAEAWGDEDPSIWPDLIKKKAKKGFRIRTLSEVVEEINRTQANFENLVGFPSLPECHLVSGRNQVRSSGSGWVGWLPGMSEVQPQLYNIHQVISVLEENAKNGGLKVLRDLFFEMYSTNRKSAQSSTSEENRLNAILKMVRMGIFRQLGRNIQLIPEQDASLHDLLQTLVDGASQQGIRDTMALLLRQDQLLFNILEQVFISFDHGSEENLKQFIYYLLANTSSLKLTQELVNNLSVAVHQYSPFLTNHSDLVQTLFRSRGISDGLRALYGDQSLEAKSHLQVFLSDVLSDSTRALDVIQILKNVSEDPIASESWKDFQTRLERLGESQAYQQLNGLRLVEDLLAFFGERSGSRVGADVARHLREFLARRLEGQNFDQFLMLTSQYPDNTLKLFKSLGEEIHNQDLNEFFNLIRRSVIDSNGHSIGE